MWHPIIEAGSTPRYKAIANAIESDIRQGRLTAGAQLPTHRDLAGLLGVTVGTVTRGYGEAARRGLLRGETGRGTFVGGETITPSILCHRENVSPSTVDMTMTHPLYEQSPDLGEALARLSRDSRVGRLLEYCPAGGRSMDREAGAAWVQQYGLETTPDRIVIAAGGQNGLAVILSAAFRANDAIGVDGLTYPLIKTLGQRFGIRLVPIEMDEFGMTPDGLDAACRSHGVRGVYLMPNCQNPTTVHIPEFRRHEIADMARQHDLTIIEDEAYGLISDTRSIPLATLAPERTFFIASLSKSVAGGLRVAYLVSPSAHKKPVARAVSDLIWMTPPLTAEIARQWIEDGTARRVIQARRTESRHRCDLAKSVLKGLDVSLQKSGYFAWLRLPDPWTSREFVREAEERGVLLLPDEAFAVGRYPLPHGVRIALSGPETLDVLERGLKTIQAILR